MTILLWVLSLVVYFGFLLFTTSRPPDINLIAGFGAILVGAAGLVTNNRMILLLSYGLMLVGEMLMYGWMLNSGLVYIWVLVLALTLFFGVLSLRQE